ncbi:MAG: AAA family ATPase [Flavobacteriales bacterium]|nr:MAG: AAA family ATPase [Flavobacteriales bacterium]
MINKRLLIRNLLTHHGESTFYDKKEKLDLRSRPTKAKFLKHICALANANPKNTAYIVVGVDDRTNELKGVDFFDDARIQNLIDAYIENPPQVQYENVPFPELPRHKVLGLVSIRSGGRIARFKRSIWSYPGGSVFLRIGSTSRIVDAVHLEDFNSQKVQNLEIQSSNNIQLTLDGVFDFLKHHENINESHYLVFKEQFVLCWAGQRKEVKNKVYYSRVDIELINEQVRLFYSYMDEVEIEISKQAFITTEYVPLHINGDYKYFPLEKNVIHFKDTGEYNLAHEMLFEPPSLPQERVDQMYADHRALLDQLQAEQPLNDKDLRALNTIADGFILCYLNGYKTAVEDLDRLKPLLRKRNEKTPYIKYKEVMRVLRKINGK